MRHTVSLTIVVETGPETLANPTKPKRSPADPDPHTPPDPVRPDPTREPTPPPDKEPEPKIEPPSGPNEPPPKWVWKRRSPRLGWKAEPPPAGTRKSG